MKSMRRNIARTLAVIAVVCAVSVAQVPSEKPSRTGPAHSTLKVSQPLPFQPGESLVYEVTFSKLIFSGIVGEIKVSVSKPADAASNLIEFKAEAVSRGLLPSLLGFKVKDTYTSMVNSIDLGLDGFKRSIHEGKTHREQTTVINRATARVTYTERDLASPNSPPKVKEAATPEWVQDVLSAIYFVRTQKLDEGGVIAIPVSDGGDLYNIEVVVGKREELKLDLGKFKTLQLNAKVFGGRFLKRSGEMLVWMSDAPQRLIVRVRIKTASATVTADLKRISSDGNGKASQPSR